MSAEIVLELTPTPLERVTSDVAVAGFFVEDRPLRGGAARADWRLCGGLSRRVEDGDLSGEAGEALLIGCGRALRSPRLLLLGLGERAGFDVPRAGDGMRAAVSRSVQLGCQRLALQPLGIASDDVPRHAGALLEALISGSAEADRDLHVELCVPREELGPVWRAFDEARRTSAAASVRLEAPEFERNAR